MRYACTLPDDCSPERALIVALLHSAITDYFYPHKIMVPKCTDKFEMIRRRARYQELARRFIFDDDFTLDWGDWTSISPASLLKYANLNLPNIRKLVRMKQEQGVNRLAHAPLLGGIVTK